LNEHGAKPARALVDLTHTHRAYKRADAGRLPGSSSQLPYEYFFDDAPGDAGPARALAQQQQEDHEFAHWLQHAGRVALTAGSTTKA
jgi:hypothetical protein